MITYEFGIDDVAAMRFAVSPVHELVTSLVALRDMETAALHRPWLQSLSGRIDGAALRPLVALVPTRGYTPDFLTPPPAGRSGEIGEELARIAATPLDQVVLDINHAAEQMGYDDSLTGPWLRDPAAALARALATMGDFWEVALAGRWGRIRALLEDDIAHRATALATGGLAATLGNLHPTARWCGDRLEVDTRHDELCVLGGRGLVLMPSAFRCRRAAAINDPPWQPTVIYPARGLATLWAPRADAGPEALGRVVGAARARLLVALDAPCSATELGRRTGMSPASVSEHLTALRDAGLATSRREGRYVVHERTERATRLLDSD
jgi:DNA-binding transcriptional ArsR family regulator